MITLSFKAKVVDGAIKIPTWKRSHVASYDGRISGYVNSNLLSPIINRELVKAMGDSMKCGSELAIDSLPAGVVVNGDFMKTVTITF